MVGGLLQQKRDRQLLQNMPFAGYSNPSILQKWIFGYDAFEEAENAWDIYLKGEGRAWSSRLSEGSGLG